MAVIRIFSVLLISVGLLQYSAAQPLPSPVIAAFDTTEGSENPLDAIPDSDIYLDRVRSVKLECWAPYPVQWTYTGNGVSCFGVHGFSVKCCALQHNILSVSGS